MSTEDDRRSDTPEEDPYYGLCRASEAGNLEEVQKFSELPSGVSDSLQSALRIAAKVGHPKIVSWLLGHGAYVTSSAAVGASIGRSIPVLQAFLDLGWNINQTNPTVLKMCIEDEAVVKWFLDHGADANLHSSGTLSPLEVAAGQSTPAVASLLISHGAKVSNTNALLEAAQGSTGVPMLECLVGHGADINALGHFSGPPRWGLMRESRLATPLFVAACNGKPDDVRYLLQRGADPTIPSTDGQTAIEVAKVFAPQDDLAAWTGWNECIKLIQQKLSDGDHPDKNPDESYSSRA